MDSTFCIAAVEEALARYGTPDIFNTDQVAQCTSAAFTRLLTDHGIQISMDGKGSWRDNIFVERLRRSLKYEEVLGCTEKRSHFTARTQRFRSVRGANPAADGR